MYEFYFMKELNCSIMYLSRIFAAASIARAFTCALAAVVIQAKKTSDRDHENVCHRLAYYLVRLQPQR